MNRRLGILLVCAGIGALQVWFWLQVLLDPGYLAHSDLYEQFLPNFLSPLTWWSSSEFAGLPVFADPQGAIWYPLHWLFAQAGHAWSAYLVSAYVVGGIGAALYAWRISGSYAAALVAGLAWPWLTNTALMPSASGAFVMAPGGTWPAPRSPHPMTTSVGWPPPNPAPGPCRS